MAFVGSNYIVKELSGEDHQALLAITESYVNHVLSRDSLLCLILLHFSDLRSGKHYFAMRNEVGTGPFQALYDLKGCADDKALIFNGKKIKPVHKRFWKVHLWCGRCAWNQARHAYYYGKMMAAEADFVVSEEKKAQVVRRIQHDTEWLQMHGLMDYSLLVALKMPANIGKKKIDDEDANDANPFSISFDDEASGNGHARQDIEDNMLSLAIIDFLQQWTFNKRVAQTAKSCETNKATVPPDVYARRFRAHFEERFISVDVAGPTVMPPAALSNPPTCFGNKCTVDYDSLADSLAEETFG